MITIRAVDRLVGLLVVGIILFGSYSWWRATQRAQERQGMMGEMMGTMPGMDPVWYLFGTLVAVSVMVGSYVLSRDPLASALAIQTLAETDPEERTEEHETVTRTARQGEHSSEHLARDSVTTDSDHVHPSPLVFLPDDEQQVVEPILESPGLTQVELRGRSNFSKAKVSQTVSKLEDRGLIYREKQGRTYRIYPGELLSNSSASGNSDE